MLSACTPRVDQPGCNPGRASTQRHAAADTCTRGRPGGPGLLLLLLCCCACETSKHWRCTRCLRWKQPDSACSPTGSNRYVRIILDHCTHSSPCCLARTDKRHSAAQRDVYAAATQAAWPQGPPTAAVDGSTRRPLQTLATQQPPPQQPPLPKHAPVQPEAAENADPADPTQAPASSLHTTASRANRPLGHHSLGSTDRVPATQQPANETPLEPPSAQAPSSGVVPLARLAAGHPPGPAVISATIYSLVGGLCYWCAGITNRTHTRTHTCPSARDAAAGSPLQEFSLSAVVEDGVCVDAVLSHGVLTRLLGACD